MRSLAIKFVLVTAIALLYAAPSRCWAAAQTCLTGTDPTIVGDLAQIAAVRSMVEAACVCSSFDGSSGKTHARYVACARSVITTQSIVGQLRTQCKATVKKYYSASTCGVPASKGVVPCISKGATGKVSCRIRSTARCGSPGRVACPSFTTCIDAADTNHDGLIKAPGDSGACAAPATPTGTAGPSLGTPTSSPTGPSSTPINTPAATTTNTPMSTPTKTPIPTATNTSSRTPTFTNTPVPPTNTPTATPCAGRFCDNGNGTITDTQTGLIWEEKNYADANIPYQWAGRCTVSGETCQPDANSAAACAAATGGATGCAECGPSAGACIISVSNPKTVWTWLLQLNATNFAGKSDWRIPTSAGCCGTPTGDSAELETIQAAQYPNCVTSPCVPAVFNTNCTPGCTHCSCTAANNYWSASSYYIIPYRAWDVDFATGGIGTASKWGDIAYVRAVRGP
jgi:hypothetical protein